MRNFMRQVPDALIETARMLGASEFRILWDIVLPLIRPAIGAVAVLTFTFVWNDYFWALVLVHSDAVRPVTAGLQSLQGMWVVSWHLTSAAAILAAIPPVAVFVLMQRLRLRPGGALATEPIGGGAALGHPQVAEPASIFAYDMKLQHRPITKQ